MSRTRGGRRSTPAEPDLGRRLRRAAGRGRSGPGLAALAASMVATGALASCGACDDTAQVPGEVAEASTEIARAEDDLLARRDAILRSRRKLRERRQELARQRQELVARGDDTTEIEQRADELAKEEQALAGEEDALLDKLDEILAQRQELTRAIASAGSSEAQIASREATLAGREQSLARREAGLARREAGLADRERQLAVRERETCAAAPPTTIIQTVDAKGSRYTRRDVDGALSRARKKMSRKGILPSDLPAAAQNLQRDATRAMERGDWGTARFAAVQLVATVDAVRIDRDFLKGKFRRVSAAAKGIELEGDARREFDALLREATTAFGDGKLARANNQLNQIHNLIAGKK